VVRGPQFEKLCSRQSAHEGGKIISPTHRPPLPPGIISGTHFCYCLSQAQGNIAAGRIMSMKNSNDTIGNRTRDPPACSTVPQPLRQRVPRNACQLGKCKFHPRTGHDGQARE
jgi:hypothetical protein